MIRCRDCDVRIDWEEAIDTDWTKLGFEYDGICYDCKIKLDSNKIKARELMIMERYTKCH